LFRQAKDKPLAAFGAFHALADVRHFSAQLGVTLGTLDIEWRRFVHLRWDGVRDEGGQVGHADDDSRLSAGGIDFIHEFFPRGVASHSLLIVHPTGDASKNASGNGAGAMTCLGGSANSITMHDLASDVVQAADCLFAGLPCVGILHKQRCHMAFDLFVNGEFILFAYKRFNSGKAQREGDWISTCLIGVRQQNDGVMQSAQNCCLV
jgi:hypothetical protein